MSNQNNEETPGKISQGITAANLLVRLLSLIEQLLPAFLVAWNNQLRQKNKALELKLEHSEVKAKVEEKKKELLANEKEPSRIIDDYLNGK